jgi:hypothetical protein
VSPFVGAHTGGLLVNITGKGFVVATDPKCRFETLQVPATVVSPTLVQCYTPHNLEGHVAFIEKVAEVSLNGVDWTNSRREFTFYDHGRIYLSLFEPEGGPTAGGTEIFIHGTGFRYSQHTRCTWDHNENASLKTPATFINYYTFKCRSPPIGESGARMLDIALDDFAFTNRERPWTYYDPEELAISAIDPIGGPAHGGTLIQVLGHGFQKLGGVVTHGAEILENNTLYRADTVDPHRLISAGTFCKFSIDTERAEWGAAVWGNYDGMLNDRPFPREGEYALSRASDDSQLRNFSAYTVSSTPSLGTMSSIVEATFETPGRMFCRVPPYDGIFTNNRAVLRVHVALNGDFHDTLALSRTNATFTLYSPKEARVTTMDRTGGPLNGSTTITITGKLFSDFTLRSFPDRIHLLRCRFGFVGDTLATWNSDQSVSCVSPAISGTGFPQAVGVDLTFNGQDYLEGRNLMFIYSPRDTYQVNGTCQDELGRRDYEAGYCLNNHTGVSVHELQPYGGPAAGGTLVVVRGRHFAERASQEAGGIECKFGNLSRVPATFLNDSFVECYSPPNPFVVGSFEDHFLDVTLNGEPNFLTDSRVPFTYYNHNTTLSISAIYPQAGPKLGGNTITVYGTGFRVLGGSFRYDCEDPAQPDTCTAPPLVETTNQGLQCIFGGFPSVVAFQRQPNNGSYPDLVNPRFHDPRIDDHTERLPSSMHESFELVCTLPELPEGECERRGLSPDEPLSVCLEVTLNGNATQATDDCVELTYYDE